MEINVKTNELEITDIEAFNRGEYNVHNLEFTFSEEYDNMGKVIKLANSKYKQNYMLDSDTFTVPSKFLIKGEELLIGIFAEEYDEDGVTLLKRYSPEPIEIPIIDGSYDGEEVTVTKNDLLQISQSINTMKGDIKELQEEKSDNIEHILVDDIELPIENQSVNIPLQNKLDDYVEKVEGKGLSTNDYTDEERTKLASLENYNDTEIKQDISNLEDVVDNLSDNKADKTEIPDVSHFIDKDVNNLTYYTLGTNTGSTIELSIDSSTYVMTFNLKNSAGTTISTCDVDLPLETMVVDASYDNLTKEIVLTLKSGATTRFSVADLVSGLQSEITSTNKLNSDLVDDTNQVNKFVSENEKQTWNNKAELSDIPDELSDLQDDSTHRTVTDTEKDTWNNKQDELTFDSTPTENSTNPVISGGIFEALQNTGGGSNDFVIELSDNNVTTFCKKIYDLHDDMEIGIVYKVKLVNTTGSNISLVYNSYGKIVQASSPQTTINICIQSISANYCFIQIKHNATDHSYTASINYRLDINYINTVKTSDFYTCSSDFSHSPPNIFYNNDDSKYLPIRFYDLQSKTNMIRNSNTWDNSDTKLATVSAIQKYVISQTGTLSNLTTTNKTSLVDAINELNTSIGSISTVLESLTTVEEGD